jgi:heat-inducible transcriptional repressor
MIHVPFNQRAQQVLKILVERYIQEGSPIGSKTLAGEYSFGLSAATIRNILADLEEGGYLSSPHPSAGRVPTPKGYRVFVDSLLTSHAFAENELQAIRKQLDPDLTMDNLLESASTLLADLTQLTGIVTLPKRNRLELRQVEFLPLSANRVLAVLVLNNREVQNRIVYTDKVYNRDELQHAANYLNSHYAGKNLLAIRQELSANLRHDQNDVADIMRTALDVAHKAFTPANQGTKSFLVSGQSHLLQHSKDSNLDNLRLLFAEITQKENVLNLLDQAIEAEGIQIFIGKEAGYEVFDDCSIITTSYAVDGQLIGSLGVIGPTRIPYEKIISAVDITAKLLSAALNQDS